MPVSRSNPVELTANTTSTFLQRLSEQSTASNGAVGLQTKPMIFLRRMCSAIASITDGFSCVYLQEAFIPSLMVVAEEQSEAGRAAEERAQDGDSSSLESVLFWRVINQQVNMLRNEIKGSRKSAEDALAYNGPMPAWIRMSFGPRPLSKGRDLRISTTILDGLYNLW